MQANAVCLEHPVQKRQKLEDANAAPQAHAKAHVVVAVPVKQAQKQKAKKKRPMTPELQLIVDIQAAAKTKQPSIGLAAYNKAVADGTQINPDLYSTLLYLCAGGDDWELPLRRQLTETSPLVQEVMDMAHTDEHSNHDAGNADALLGAAATSAAQDSSGPRQQQQQPPPPDGDVAASTGSRVGASTASGALASPTFAPRPAEVSASTASSEPSTSAAEPKVSSAKGPMPDAEPKVSSAKGPTPDEEAVAASPSRRDVPPMSAVELHSVGRTIFAQMQARA